MCFQAISSLFIIASQARLKNLQQEWVWLPFPFLTMDIKLSHQKPIENAADLCPSQFSYLDGIMDTTLWDFLSYPSSLWSMCGAWRGKNPPCY